MYVLGVAAFSLLISIDFLAIWAEYLLEHQASPGTVGRLMLYRLPWFLHLSLPVAVVFAVLIVTGRMSKDSELKAAYALGVQPMRLLIPMLLLGLLVSGISLINNGFVEPGAQVRYNRLLDSFFYTRPPTATQRNAAFAIEDEGVYYASRIRAIPDQQQLAELRGVLVLTDDGRTITASDGEWDSEERVWRLFGAQVHISGEEPAVLGDTTLPFDLDRSAQQALQRQETLSLPELSRQIEAVRSAGGNARDLSFQFHRQVADAFSALVFVLFAGTLGLGVRGRAAGFGWTIVLLVTFWATWTLAGNMFETGFLGAVTAAWLTPAVVGIGGLGFALWRLRA